MYELYQRWVEEHGLKKAQWLYGINAITFLRPSAVKKRKTKSDYSTNHTIMFSNYFKIAYRNLLKSKVFSFINLAGFSLGFVPAIFIALYVIDELSFDAFHTNADRIYRITETIRDETGERQGVGAAAQVAPTTVERLPEVERAVRVAAFGRLTLGYGEFRDFEENWFVDANFFKLFDFQFIAGNPETALDEPYSIVLTQTLATKYFGDELPLGKSMYGSFENEVTVTGIIEDFPSNSHLNPSLLFSTSTLSQKQMTSEHGQKMIGHPRPLTPIYYSAPMLIRKTYRSNSLPWPTNTVRKMSGKISTTCKPLPIFISVRSIWKMIPMPTKAILRTYTSLSPLACWY